MRAEKSKKDPDSDRIVMTYLGPYSVRNINKQTNKQVKKYLKHRTFKNLFCVFFNLNVNCFVQTFYMNISNLQRNMVY